MKILLTGGTGFVGGEVLRQLRTAGYDVCLLARQPSSRRTKECAEAHQAEIRPGDVTQAWTLTPAMAGTDAVIHLVGVISEIGANTFENVHVQGTRNLLAAAREAGLRRLVHMSALGTRPDAPSRYHQSKWSAETLVRQSGLPFTIFRPSIIYGPHDQFVNTFARISRFSPVFPLIGSGQTKFQPVAVEDVAACFVKALIQPEATNQTFDLVGNETLSLAQMADAIGEITGRRRPKLPVSPSLARLAARIFEVVFPVFLRRPAPLNRDQLLMLREDNVGNGRPAQELFGLALVSFREGIRRYLAPSGQ
jgi:uncharacterized protein YbjT (DUF2867 family)